MGCRLFGVQTGGPNRWPLIWPAVEIHVQLLIERRGSYKGVIIVLEFLRVVRQQMLYNLQTFILFSDKSG